jgi:hypothetical protein
MLIDTVPFHIWLDWSQLEANFVEFMLLILLSAVHKIFYKVILEDYGWKYFWVGDNIVCMIMELSVWK